MRKTASHIKIILEGLENDVHTTDYAGFKRDFSGYDRQFRHCWNGRNCDYRRGRCARGHCNPRHVGLEVGKEMAGRLEMIGRRGGRVLITSVLAFFLMAGNVWAISRPVIDETEWRTGGLVIELSGLIPGAEVIVELSKDRKMWNVIRQFTADSTTYSTIEDGLENGQTYYIRAKQSIGGETSDYFTARQTPPITVFVINWPEIQAFFEGLADDLISAINEIDDSINLHLDGLFTPSPGAIADLQDAINDLRDALGVGQVGQIGTDLQDGIGNIGGNLRPPIVTDDGEHTYTGGPNGSQSPFDLNPPTGGDVNLQYPNLDSGTDTELSFRIPITKDMSGNWVYVKLFTKEQMEKYMWIDLLRNLATAAMWILFAIWVVTRFTPQFKT